MDDLSWKGGGDLKCIRPVAGGDYRIAEIGIPGASYQSYTPHCILSIAADARLPRNVPVVKFIVPY
jgi:hypothetical protein